MFILGLIVGFLVSILIAVLTKKISRDVERYEVEVNKNPSQIISTEDPVDKILK